ncbi:MAG TPA: SRPBCC family protein [Labilithrix sp.]|jgi:hypothetical protein|nr:SRPBCC family protein [Labilithrix sp.]
MLVPSVLLLVIGLLGAFDIAWFHTYKGRLVERPECRREVVLHVLRGVVYAVQFVVVPNVAMRGAWLALLGLLFAVDVVVGIGDIALEPKSRAPQGGLSAHEYLIHMILSVLVGAELCSIASGALPLVHEKAAIEIVSVVPLPLRVVLGVMAALSLACAIVEAMLLAESSRGPAAPIHVRVRLAASLERAWNLTQDHRLHPSWDHRFDRIVMDHDDGSGEEVPLGTPDPRIGTGTTMRYEKSVLGTTIRGFGRYALHRPMRQSTFAFGSDDPRSLIARGVGLWLYTDLGDGRVEMSTSYTYEVRWGVFGRLFDRLVFRPLFQRYTEASFRRLARVYFADRRPCVLGREGRRPKRFETLTATIAPARFAAAS